MSGSAFTVTHHAFSSGAGRTSDGNGSHASTLKSPSYTKSVSWQHYPENEERVPAEYLPRISGVFEHCESRKEFYGRQLETAASHYETQLRPPFFRALVDYVNQGNSAFDCPGH